MTFVVRPATQADLRPLYEMAKLTGGGFTNLPPDRPALAAKLARGAAALARDDDRRADELFVLMLEDTVTGEVRGTGQIMTEVGGAEPFYSYRVGALTQHAPALGRTFRADMLSLVTDLEGSTEVGGLFLHPAARAGGLGALLARARYLFIAAHRPRFADRILAELRGVIDEAGDSPFWDGLAGRFFGMGFAEADRFNAANGHGTLAALMPKHPIFTAMLTEGARAAIGRPHPSGRAAMRMLEEEGFAHDRYVDIFDGGPTMTARTDQVRSIAGAREAEVVAIDASVGEEALVATGRLATFRCALSLVTLRDDGVAISSASAAALRLTPGDRVRFVPRWGAATSG